jgi:hypothetical protein
VRKCVRERERKCVCVCERERERERERETPGSLRNIRLGWKWLEMANQEHNKVSYLEIIV